MVKIRFYRNSPVADGRALYEGALSSGEKYVYVYPAHEVDAEIERLTDQLKSQNDEAKRLEAELSKHGDVVEAASELVQTRRQLPGYEDTVNYFFDKLEASVKALREPDGLDGAGDAGKTRCCPKCGVELTDQNTWKCNQDYWLCRPCAEWEEDELFCSSEEGE